MAKDKGVPESVLAGVRMRLSSQEASLHSTTINIDATLDKLTKAREHQASATKNIKELRAWLAENDPTWEQDT